MTKPLPSSFFNRPTLTVARELLGKYIVRRHQGHVAAVMITEVEEYDGPEDMASHARRGLTPRTKIMFGPAGYLYIYFVYGIHWMINVVTGPKEYPAAILLRAGVYTDMETKEVVRIKGPALLARFLKIGGGENGLLAARKNNVWFEDRGVIVSSKQIVASRRVGVDYAGPVWQKKHYNFKLEP